MLRTASPPFEADQYQSHSQSGHVRHNAAAAGILIRGMVLQAAVADADAVIRSEPPLYGN